MTVLIKSVIMNQSQYSYPTQQQVQAFTKDFVDNANQHMDIMTLEQLQRLHDVLERAENKVS